MTVMKKVYFAGSIRGGRADAELYARIIDYLKEKGHIVLTEHVGHPELNLLEQGKDRDGAIYAQDTAWLRESDMLIGECTSPSLGVGYELAYAERFGKPCYLFYNKSRTQLSAMLTGDPYFHIFPYETENELFEALDRVLAAQN
jgi:nucleoside 2-deoxyribosyltransferase